MWIEQVQRTSAQFEKFNGRLGPQSYVRLPVEPALFAFSKTREWKGIVGIIIGIHVLVSVLQTH